jgi:endonuclease/exonuclease/phosphatase family metal-dependent hydrolase
MKRVSATLFIINLLLTGGVALGVGTPSEDAGTGAGGRTETPEGTLVVGSLNIHYVAEGQRRLDWQERKGAVAAAIREGNPDIMAFQEMETFEGGHFSDRNVQLNFLREQFPEYRFAAVGDPRVYPFTQPIMYRRERFDQLEQGFFFFSPTPDEIYADPWKGRYPAFASWARFVDRRSGSRFYLYNLHFDYQSRENRLRSAGLVARRVRERDHPQEGVLVVGDFNAPRFFRPPRIVAEAGLEVAETTGSTVHFFRGINILPAIDHLLFSEHFEHRSTRVLRRRFQGTWPSDHYPLFVTLALTSES